MKHLFFLLFSFVFIHTSQAQVNDGYTDKQSYHTGETVNFYINAVHWTAWHIFWYGDVVLWITDINGNLVYDPNSQLPIGFISPNIVQNNSVSNTSPWQDGFDYGVSLSWQIPSYIKSGVYYLDGKIPFIVKGDKTTSDVVIVCPTNNINAYTGNAKIGSGGKSLYDDCVNHPDCKGTGGAATTVSFLRPQEFEQGWFDSFMQWLTNQSYNVNVIADIDLDQDYSEVANAKVFVIHGHSEYWTRAERENLDKFINVDGKNLLCLSGNSIWWQVRYNSDRTKLTCYRADDAQSSYNSVYNSTCDPLLASNRWYTPSQKYSILGSIGADSRFGGFGLQGSSQYHNANNVYFCDYGGFGGFNVLKPNSPIFNNLNYWKKRRS